MIVAKTAVLAAALSIIAMLSLAAAGQANAETSNSGIATWVDENGVTHFGNSQFAPANASTVAVAPANGMDVPAAVPSSSSDAGKPSMVAIRKTPNRQTKGWRGFAGFRKMNPNRSAGNR
jgi:hypothetical protein